VRFLICDLIWKASSSAGFRFRKTLALVHGVGPQCDVIHLVSAVAINLYLQWILEPGGKRARICALYKAIPENLLGRPYYLRGRSWLENIGTGGRGRISENILLKIGISNSAINCL
jgi:hypothetical protein